jgi:hypothetical protein
LKTNRILSATAAGLLLAACSDPNGPGMITAPTGIRPLTSTNTPVQKAAFTTTNPAVDVTGSVTEGDLCKNGNPAVNCNLYGAKAYVWMNGGPLAAGLKAGKYFFAVLQPGGQGGNEDPNDGTEKNLSDQAPSPWTAGVKNSDGSTRPAGDVWTNREFEVVVDATTGAKSIKYTGDHTFDKDNNKIRLFPYDDTPNNGGVYIMAICSLADRNAEAANQPGVVPNDCKYDAFKVQRGGGGGGGEEAAVLDIEKSVVATFDENYTYLIDKTVDPLTAKYGSVGSEQTFTYSVSVTRNGPTRSGWELGGKIRITNTNAADVIIDGVEDQLIGAPAGSSCTVSGLPLSAADRTIPAAGAKSYDYSCTLSSWPAELATGIRNYAKVTWSAQTLGKNAAEQDIILRAGDNEFLSAPITFEVDQVTNEEATVTDKFGTDQSQTLGTMTLADASPRTFPSYQNKIVVVPNACKKVDNTATVTPNDGGKAETDTKSATACPNGTTGGNTIGYWQNNNGQRRISTVASCAALRTHLRTYEPFKAALSETVACGIPVTGTKGTGVVTSSITEYVFSVIKAANASGASMEAMLRAQMLATALNTYFTPSLGTAKIDITKICTSVKDNLGVYSCLGTLANYTSFWGSNDTPATMLKFTSDNWIWTLKADQEKAKNTFDAINNNYVMIVP